jgi:predicted small secreted protein
MKKIAIVTVAVLALGLAACNKNTDNNAANETAVENNADLDVNAASNDATAVADNALNAAGNAVDNAGNAVDNASDAVANTATNQ